MGRPFLTQRRRGAENLLLVSLFVGLLAGCQVVRLEPAPTPIVPAIVTTVPTIAPTETAVSTTSPPSPTLSPTNIPTSQPATIEPTATINPDTGWQDIQPGLERRHIYVFDEENQPRDRLTILRLDPAFFDVRIAYRPGEAQAWKHGRQKQMHLSLSMAAFLQQKITPRA
jgi:hypothetical protein